jgi:hypothetical protein
MNSLMQIGASKEAIIEARKSILEILKSNNDQRTICKALEAFSKICETSNVSVSNCHFQSK